MFKKALLGAAAALVAPGMAAAQDYPRLTVEAELSLQSEKTVGSKSAKKIHDTFAEVETGIALFFTEALSLQSVLKLEPVRSATESRAFEDEGAFVEELYLNFEQDWLRLYGGKFNPPFGTAWDRLSELFQRGFAEDYERTEALGAGAAVTLETLSYGTHTLGATLFHADNTFLSNSAFARPRFGDDDTDRVKRTRRRHGGPANTHDFSSYTVTLDGDQLPMLEGLSYHLGYSRLDDGVTEIRSEKGYVGALQWAFDLGHDITLTPLAELAHFRHFGGGTDHATYLTTALQFGWGDWSLVAVRTGRHIDEPSDGSGAFGHDYTDTLYSVLLGYSFDFGVTAQLGWKREKVQGEPVIHALGVRITYELHF
jgi:hypothetical protein